MTLGLPWNGPGWPCDGTGMALRWHRDGIGRSKNPFPRPKPRTPRWTGCGPDMAQGAAARLGGGPPAPAQEGDPPVE
eukprot:10123368-Alexandrium_andersonii.AAC.1